MSIISKEDSPSNDRQNKVWSWHDKYEIVMTLASLMCLQAASIRFSKSRSSRPPIGLDDFTKKTTSSNSGWKTQTYAPGNANVLKTIDGQQLSSELLVCQLLHFCFISVRWRIFSHVRMHFKSYFMLVGWSKLAAPFSTCTYFQHCTLYIVLHRQS